MCANEIAVKKYVVTLSADECEQLQTLIRGGKHPARILLKADISEAGDAWSDSKIGVHQTGAIPQVDKRSYENEEHQHERDKHLSSLRPTGLNSFAEAVFGLGLPQDLQTIKGENIVKRAKASKQFRLPAEHNSPCRSAY